MAALLAVEAARPDELPAAFRLMYQHLAASDRDDCADRSLQLVRQGDLQASDVLVIRGPAGLRGTMVCCAGAGACGQLWPPQVADGEQRQALEDALVRHGLARLRGQGARFVQCLLPPEDAALAPALTRNGLHNPTALLLMRHRRPERGDASHQPPPAWPLTYQTYSASTAEYFAATLLRTYEGTLDFPELNGIRSAAAILEGHKAHGVFNPALWLLALQDGIPVGMVMLTEIPEVGEWELAYLGVVPEARGRGVGRALVRKALHEARSHGAAQLTVAVDRRNHIARELYRREGFEAFDVRDVYLILWPPPPA